MTLILNEVYSGYRQVPVIHNINLKITPGEVVGLVGLNGAGKSTLLKTILGLLPTQSGTITLNHHTLAENHTAYAKQIAYIPETPILYEELTLREHIEMTALGYDLSVEDALQRAEPLLEIFRLNQHLDWFPTHFSKGMKQKVMIICALITNAQLLIIDEPFLGLDPLAIRDFTQLIQQAQKMGKMVLFTTHILSIADQFCDRYILLSQGKIVGNGNLNQLRKQFDMPTASLDDIYIAMAEGAIGQVNGSGAYD